MRRKIVLYKNQFFVCNTIISLQASEFTEDRSLLINIRSLIKFFVYVFHFFFFQSAEGKTQTFDNSLNSAFDCIETKFGDLYCLNEIRVA